MKLQLSILRVAALLVPREQREEWSAEWRAELWYVRRSGKPGTAFCLGAFKDAFWLRRNNPPSPPMLRLESPFVCLFFLAGLAVVVTLVCGRPGGRETVMRLPYFGPRNLVMIAHVRRPLTDHPTIRFAEYQRWMNGDQHLFSGLAFYQTLEDKLRVAGHETPKLSIARATDNLFQLLRIPFPRQDAGVRLVLGEKAWRDYFHADPQIVGRIVEVAGERAVVAGVISDSVWSLPGRADAWLLQDPQSLSDLASDARGFVLARMQKTSVRYMSAPNASGGREYFDLESPYQHPAGPVAAFLMAVLFSSLLLPVTTSVSSGEYPCDGLRRWMFLAAKFALVLWMVYCGAREVAYHGMPGPFLLIGCVLALRWVLVDQRRRCPVCLRLLGNPVRIGRPSQTFLEWYGTELMCARGHGLLHVTELPGSCYGSQRWLGLDGSWSSLFLR